MVGIGAGNFPVQGGKSPAADQTGSAGDRKWRKMKREVPVNSKLFTGEAQEWCNGVEFV